MKDGTINLASVRYFTDRAPMDGELVIQMKSTNLSANTTFNLYLSLNGTDWDIAQESGTDISDTLIANETKIKSFLVNKGIHFKIEFTGVTTGLVQYLYS